MSWYAVSKEHPLLKNYQEQWLAEVDSFRRMALEDEDALFLVSDDEAQDYFHVKQCFGIDDYHWTAAQRLGMTKETLRRKVATTYGIRERYTSAEFDVKMVAAHIFEIIAKEDEVEKQLF